MPENRPFEIPQTSIDIGKLLSVILHYFIEKSTFYPKMPSPRNNNLLFIAG